MLDEDEIRIVGGEEVEPKSIPWQVYLKIKSTHGKRSYCGGTIICPRFVMSAAHCFRRKGEYKIYVGVHTKDDLTEDHLHKIKKIYKHPKYNGIS